MGCKKRFDQDQLLAVTRLKSGQVVINAARKEAGRSVYLCKKQSCLLKAVNRKGQNALQYGLKVQIPSELRAELEKILK